MMNGAQMLISLAREYGVSVDDLRGLDRSKHLAAMRAIGMESIRHTYKLSYPRLAKLFGRLDHTTAIACIKRAPKYRQEYPHLSMACVRALDTYVWSAELAVENLETCT